MKKLDRRAMIGSTISDILDVIPPLPGLDTMGSIIDASNIQYIRSKYPEAKTSTAIELLETIEFPIPFLPSPLELAPSHILATWLAVRQRKAMERKARNKQALESSPWRKW